MLLVKKVILTLALLLLLAALLLVYLKASPAARPFKDDQGNIIPGNIAVLEAIELNGVEQWISIRSQDRTNPVLLWLHGGPGAAQISFSHHLDGELEKHYVVVHWDQRGAGKSNHRNFSEQTMSVVQYKEDALALIAYLIAFLEQEKVFILGHSWGTQFGLELVAEHPELFYAYIAVSQVVDHARAVNYASPWLRQEMEKAGDEKGLTKLNEIKEPALYHRDYREFASLVSDYSGDYDLSFYELAAISFRAPEYALFDYYRLFQGMKRGGAPLHPEGVMNQFNYIEKVPALEVPIYFLIGKHDYNTPLQLVEEYSKSLEAPYKKLVVFKHSAHVPFLSEPEKFTATLIGIKEEALRIAPLLE